MYPWGNNAQCGKGGKRREEQNIELSNVRAELPIQDTWKV